MILLLDNYDSFTYILQDYLLQLGQKIQVFRNDALTAQQAEALHPEALVLSPGPERPERAGNLMSFVAHFHNRIPILGICLGHQAIGLYFGARLGQAARIMHGRTSEVYHNGHPLFDGIPSPFPAMRYHSLLLYDLNATPLQLLAQTDEQEVMGILHHRYKICGFQFHPESILTPHGLLLLRNWLLWAGLDAAVLPCSGDNVPAHQKR
ncbi:MAG: aminodeoxychorismate/anthranilate synthase component II [Chitinophagales bacterium]|nr:aminodeoxychorismate/anthranilate synthase component II [Chitinophagales bacterium]MDW8392930.1 aminodeoxychorismate/anthranilate synthase component II [Chitinophagales bacterium]